MTLEQAKDWAEEKLVTGDYKALFEVAVDTSKNKLILNLTVSEMFKAKLTEMKQKTGKSISQIIEDKFTELGKKKRGLTTLFFYLSLIACCISCRICLKCVAFYYNIL